MRERIANPMRQEYPILEFDPARDALIEPCKIIKRIDIPEPCVLTFFRDVLDKLAQEGRAEAIDYRRSEMGRHPGYRLELEGQPFVAYACGVGASLAGALLEEIIAVGCRRFIVCGGAGVLDGEVTVGKILVPTAAVRDEGTSYHYLQPSREAHPSPVAVRAIEEVLGKRDRAYLEVKTWTTDAFYRETPAKIRLRREEGCVTVEMEAAALFAIAEFRGVPLAQMLYAGDDVSGGEWDSRDWHERPTTREGLFWLAAEACLAIGVCPSCSAP